MQFTLPEAQILAQSVERFTDAFQHSVVDVLAAQFRGCRPPEVTELIGELSILKRQLEIRHTDFSVHDANAPLLKRILVEERRRIAAEIEIPLQKAVSGQLIRMLRRELGTIEFLMDAPWFHEATPQRIPSLTDYLSIRHAEAAGAAPQLEPRVFDEKFHILEAPSLFLPDLRYYRTRCGLRGRPVSVAFLDIDDFKEFNTRHTETKVDIDLLVPLMEAIEAQVFSHGHAYRFGGDEYVLTLPNQTTEGAIAFLRDLATRIAEAPYRGMHRVPTVSMGLCVVEIDSILTDREVQARANVAKNFVKGKEKGRIATYTGMLFRESDLVLA